MKKSYKIMLLAAFVAFAVGALYFLLKPSDKAEEKKPEQSVLIDVPEAESEDLQTSKSEAYRKAAGRRENYDDYFDSLIGDDEKQDDADISLVSGADTAPSRPQADPQDKVNKVLGVSEEEPESPRNSQPQKPKSTKPKGGGGSSSRTSSATSDKKFVQDMDRARAIAAAMGMKEEGSGSSASASGSGPEEKIEIPDSRPSSTGIISSLDDWAALGNDIDSGSDAPVKCMFIRDEKIKNGQRVTIRTLQDFVVGGQLIPANSHLTAVCSIAGRLTMNIASVEIGGRIINLNYDAYDFDGSKGIYCPETTASKGARSATSQAVSQGSSLIGGYVGTIASAVVRTGASLMQTANGESCVYLSNGYEFYIMKHKQ